MHYKNGTEAKVGDEVVGVDCNGNAVGGILVKIHAGTDACNGYVIPFSAVYSYPVVTLNECLPATVLLPTENKR